MIKIHTHYDTLKVARDASPERIHAAYRALSFTYHPDRNQGDANASRIMATINASYDVLSNPVKRKEHDAWIEKEQQTRRTAKSSGKSWRRLLQTVFLRSGAHGTRCGKGYAITVLLFCILFFFYKVFHLVGVTVPHRAAPMPRQPPYVRPVQAPNGKPWPSSAGYLFDVPCFNMSGRSTVTVDNSQNESDVYVKLVSLNGTQAYPVRQFYLPALSSFTLYNVTAGTYDIRYQDLDNGTLARSTMFTLQEIKTESGTQVSTITLTLYTVEGENRHPHAIAEDAL